MCGLSRGKPGKQTDAVLELSCNVDDMTAKQLGFAMERLFAGGARDAYTVPISMRKSRPGTLIHVLCLERDREEMSSLLFRHTMTLDVREAVLCGHTLNRRIETVQTPYGEVRRKCSAHYRISRVKYEYEDLARITTEKGLSLEELLAGVETQNT